MLLDQNERRTARMNYQHPRRMLTPGASRLKRKEREQPFYPTKPSPLAPVLPPLPPAEAASQQTPRATVTTATTVTTSRGVGGEEAMSSNQVLAGYMAYEFLTKGTLLGQKFDPARAEAVPVSGGRLKSNINMSSSSSSRSKGAAKKQSESYIEVASLLMRKKEGEDGAHVAGVVNPTQLARWIQM